MTSVSFSLVENNLIDPYNEKHYFYNLPFNDLDILNENQYFRHNFKKKRERHAGTLSLSVDLGKNREPLYNDNTICCHELSVCGYISHEYHPLRPMTNNEHSFSTLQKQN